MNENELIVVKQLPIIEENLKSLSEEIDKKVENAKSLVCTNESVKEVKKLRAEFNKEFKELETQRKLVKSEIEKPYKDFEEIYKKYISDKFNLADKELANKINEVESELKHSKEEEVREYFEELKKSANIDFIDFVDTDIVVNLSSTMKSLKTQCKEFVDKVAEDLKTIATQTYADEIEVEYRKTKDLNKSIQEVTDRHNTLEQLERIKESAKETVELEQQAIEKVDEVLQAPTEEDILEGQMSIDDFEQDDIYEATFKVRGTLEDLKEIKQFLKDGGFEYESITD